MKVLTVTNMWPVPDSPYYGIFVKEQVEALEKYYPEVNNKVYFINGRINKINYLWSIFKINWLLLFNKYDVVHIHYALSGLFLLMNPFIKIPVVTTIHGSDFNCKDNFYKKIISAVLGSSSDIIYLNRAMLNNLKKYKKKLHHIPCGVDTELFVSNRTTKENDSITIAFPASKSRPEKNYKFFEKIIRTLESENSFKINIIEIHGKTRGEVNEVLNNVDVLCMTSLREGSPQIIKEAMCCNTPIVSSNVGDVKDLLIEVENTIVLDEYNVDDFSKAINQLLNFKLIDPITNGRKKVLELGLDEQSTSAKIMKVYKD